MSDLAPRYGDLTAGLYGSARAVAQLIILPIVSILVLSALMEDEGTVSMQGLDQAILGLKILFIIFGSFLALISFLRRHPDLHPLLLGLGLPQLRELAKKCDNFSTDTSFIEWMDSLVDFTREFPPRRVLLGTHAPFLVTAASLAKLSAAPLPARTRAAIGRGNAARFFSL